MRRPTLGVLGALLVSVPASAHDLVVEPYLQVATPTSVRVLWESNADADSQVEYGLTDALGSLAVGQAAPGADGSLHHDVLIDGLTPGTRYHYRPAGVPDLPIRDFITPSLAGADAPLRLVAMSDMQGDSAHPDVFREIVEDGVLAYLAAEHSPDLPSELDFALIPGDLVRTGRDRAQWADQFFTPGRELFSRVPVYPILGNHEDDSPLFFDYFHLPDNGSPGFEEHWWFHDVGNVRVIGLDSNLGYIGEPQTEWLQGVLDDACVADDIDFVFAQLHHPYKSELWVPGENPWTGTVIGRLEAFSTDCGKPSVHFFGHTHGYSRGQSRDHQHLWVNVATAGGRIDRWGEYEQRDYPEFVTSQDEYGFVLVDVEAGDAPTFRLRRLSRGTPESPEDNVLRDSLEVRANNTPPERPRAEHPVDGDAVDPSEIVVVASAFADPDGDGHGASHWQIGADCGFETPLWEAWRQDRNEYFDEDLQAGDDLTDVVARGLPPETALCWRVRYRDAALAWSAWSEGATFASGRSSRTDNLLRNGGAEEGTEFWSAEGGTVDVVEQGDCEGVLPREGARALAVGGRCEAIDAGAAVQDVGAGLWGGAIDDGLVVAEAGGWARGGTGDGGLRVEARGADGAVLAASEPVLAEARWQRITAELPLPVGTRSVRLHLASSGSNAAGLAWFDDLDLRLRFLDPPAPVDPPPEEGCGGCSAADGSSAGGLLLAPLIAARRRRTP